MIIKFYVLSNVTGKLNNYELTHRGQDWLESLMKSLYNDKTIKRVLVRIT